MTGQCTAGRFDVQLLVRVSAKDGSMTVLGLMFNTPLELDFRLCALGGWMDLTAIPLVQQYISQFVTDSLLWMTKPDMCTQTPPVRRLIAPFNAQACVERV